MFLFGVSDEAHGRYPVYKSIGNEEGVVHTRRRCYDNTIIYEAAPFWGYGILVRESANMMICLQTIMASEQK